jgi:uncharacterized protein involved in exopolysaccharide biosynthesis
MWRQSEAKRQLELIGPLGRRVHRRERLECEHREDAATTDIQRLTGQLQTLTHRHGALVRLQRQYTTWENDHQPELDRYQQLDNIVRTREVAARAAQKEPSREVDHGLELGL